MFWIWIIPSYHSHSDHRIVINHMYAKWLKRYGYVYLFDTFIPMLKERGITEKEIDLMLKENPARIFA